MRRFPLPLFILIVVLTGAARGQSPNGTISGLVLDSSERAIVGAEVLIVNDATGVKHAGTTNGDGIYAIPNLPPGPYRIQVSKIGFKTLIKPDVVLNVQSAVAINFTLPVGAVSETLTVEGGASLLDTESAAVSTVVDRQFAENLPLNGRSFQTLIQLTPGVVPTASNQADAGQFSINGQRGASNYWMLDGVSANVGVSTNFDSGNGLGGSLGSFSVLGGTNSLVSVDAMQEFRIQTSTYAPEFGRVPGGQISIVTRPGTNRFHWTLFDYFRNDVLDANDWFANSKGQPKPAERQNDFGGTVGGPILRDRTFFFLSYEGLRLRLPQTKLTSVPDLDSRQNATLDMHPYFAAYPLPNGPEITDAQGNPTGAAELNASYSNPATLDAYSIRIDRKLGSRLTLFGRYNHSPSELVQRGPSTLYSLSVLQASKITTQTATLGATWAATPQVANDLRFNYSKANGTSSLSMDSFKGAEPLTTLPFPDPYTSQNGEFILRLFGLANDGLSVGTQIENIQSQLNFVDNLSVQRGSHTLKFGVDYRRLAPSRTPPLYVQQVGFFGVPDAQNGNVFFSVIQAGRNSNLLLQNLGFFAQDTWRVTPRLVATYGLRWDIDFAPSSIEGPGLPAVTGYDLTDLSKLALAAAGTPPFKTPYGNLAPRVGLAYQISNSADWGLMARGGLGVFYDLATSEVGGAIGNNYPFGAIQLGFGGSFPLDPETAAPPPITPAQLSAPGALLSAFDPNLHLPNSLEWNVALEQGLGKQQTLSATYIGAAGRRLLQTAYVNSPTPNLYSAALIGNTATSDYDALQLQFQRQLAAGLQALASYTWAHSIDTGSAGSYTNGANTVVPGLGGDANRGDSAFDVRNALSAAITYQVPFHGTNSFASAALRGWSIQNVFQALSSPPVNVYYSQLPQLLSANTQIRPDVVAGTPLYLYGSQYPGDKSFNPAAFAPPPTDSNGLPLRQGNLHRNALRGFGAFQWDFALHRDFAIHEVLKLQFRAEMFNLLNHPNFGPPVGDLSNPQFGTSSQMLAQSLNGNNLGGGAFNPLYQMGGPRSIQLALKLIF